METPAEQCLSNTTEVYSKAETADKCGPLEDKVTWKAVEYKDGELSTFDHQNKLIQNPKDVSPKTNPLVKEEYIEIEVTCSLDYLDLPDSPDTAVCADTPPITDKYTGNISENIGAIKLISDAKVKDFCKRRNRIRHPTSKERKLYECDECGKKFVRNAHLVIHKRFHSGSKPFRCEECGIYVATISILNEHRRIHTGEKPYTCDVCDISFSKISNLKRHKMIHNGHKPYLCDVCSTPFGRKSHLEKHRKTHS